MVAVVIAIVVEYIQILRKECKTRAHTDGHTYTERVCCMNFDVSVVAVFAKRRRHTLSSEKKPQQQQQQRQRDVHFRLVCASTSQQQYRVFMNQRRENKHKAHNRIHRHVCVWQRWEICEIALWKKHTQTKVTSIATASATATAAAAPPEKYAIRSIFSHHQVSCAIS